MKIFDLSQIGKFSIKQKESFVCFYCLKLLYSKEFYQFVSEKYRETESLLIDLVKLFKKMFSFRAAAASPPPLPSQNWLPKSTWPDLNIFKNSCSYLGLPTSPLQPDYNIQTYWRQTTQHCTLLPDSDKYSVRM